MIFRNAIPKSFVLILASMTLASVGAQAASPTVTRQVAGLKKTILSTQLTDSEKKTKLNAFLDQVTLKASSASMNEAERAITLHELSALRARVRNGDFATLVTELDALAAR